MGGFMDKLKAAVGIDSSYDDFDEYYDEPMVSTEETRVEETQSYKVPETDTNFRKVQRSNVLSMHESTSDRLKINIHEPLKYDEAPAIIDDIIARKVVVLNIEMSGGEDKRQIFDFVSGGIYALKGTIQKVSTDIFVIAPKGVDIDGKIKEQIQSKGVYTLNDFHDSYR